MMDILGQSALLVAVVSFAIGFAVLARNVRNKLFLSFALLTTLVSAWSLCFFVDKIWPGYGFYRLHLFFNVWLAPAGLILIQVLARIQDKLSFRILELSILQAIFLSLALLFHLEPVPWILEWVYYSPAPMVIQTLHLMWIDWDLKRGKHRAPKLPTVGLGRKNLIYGGAVLVLVTSVMDHVPWMGEVIPSLGNLALTAYLFFLSQAITQQRLLNMGALFSRFLVLLVVALTLTGVYSLLVAWIENSPGLFFLNSFIASFLILMLLEPLRDLVSYFTQRLLTKKHRRLQQFLREAQRKLTGTVELNTLFLSILTTVEQTLQPHWAALFILRSDGTKFRRVRTIGSEPQSVGLKEVLVNDPMIQYCEDQSKKGKFPALLDQILESEMDRTASRTQRDQYARLIEGLRALGSNLLVPLMASGKLLGFVATKVPSPPASWENNWGFLPVLYPYFEQAGETLRNMEVFTQQREKERLAALGEMAAGLAHEIRNPLGAIKGAAQFLDPTRDRPESKFLKIIIEEVDRLNRVVTQFLDYSKPYSTEFALVDLVKLTEETLERMKPGMSSHIRLEFQPLSEPVRVLASAEQLRQVIINLIQNAQQALTTKTTGWIRVSLFMPQLKKETNKESLRDGSKVREVALLVEDNGPGIKKEHLDKLFIPFFTTSPSGTGLGLSICHKIIEAHRGRIEVGTEEGKFTRFVVILPLLKE